MVIVIIIIIVIVITGCRHHHLILKIIFMIVNKYRLIFIFKIFKIIKIVQYANNFFLSITNWPMSYYILLELIRYIKFD